MANIKSQIKRNRQNEKRRLRNRNFRGSARVAVKDARASFATGADSQEAVLAAISALDRAAQKGAIHPRNAARRKGRLMKQLGGAGMVSRPAAKPAVTGAEAAAKAEKKTAAKSTAKKAAPKKTSTPRAKKTTTTTKK